MSKTHKYNVFISCGGSGVEASRAILRRLEANGFVSSSRALDFGLSSSINPVIQDFWQSAVCLLVYGPQDHTPWFDNRIGWLINQRTERSHGEFRVISVVSCVGGGFNRRSYSRDHFIDSDSVIEYEYPFDDAAKFQELVWLIRGVRPTPHRFFGLPTLRQWIMRRAKNALNVNWSKVSRMLTPSSAVEQTLAWLGDRFKPSQKSDGFVYNYDHHLVPDLETSQSKLLFVYPYRAKPERPDSCDLMADSFFRSHIQQDQLSDLAQSFYRAYSSRWVSEAILPAKSGAWLQAERYHSQLLNRYLFYSQRCMPAAMENLRIVNLQPQSGALGRTDFGCSLPIVGSTMMPFHVETSYTSEPAKIRFDSPHDVNDFFIVFKTHQAGDFYHLLASAANVNYEEIEPFVIRDLPLERFNLFSCAGSMMGKSVMLRFSCCVPPNHPAAHYGSSRSTIIFDNFDAATSYLRSDAIGKGPATDESGGAVVCKWPKKTEANLLFRLGLNAPIYKSTPARLTRAQVSYHGVRTADPIKAECSLDGSRDENAGEVSAQRITIVCQGRVTISKNDLLFQLIGTAYGGDGAASFALPDLRGRVPVPVGQASEISPPAVTVEVPHNSMVVVSPWRPVGNAVGAVEERIQ
jgi:hypothetical protein